MMGIKVNSLQREAKGQRRGRCCYFQHDFSTLSHQLSFSKAILNSLSHARTTSLFIHRATFVRDDCKNRHLIATDHVFPYCGLCLSQKTQVYDVLLRLKKLAFHSEQDISLILQEHGKLLMASSFVQRKKMLLCSSKPRAH